MTPWRGAAPEVATPDEATRTIVGVRRVVDYVERLLRRNSNLRSLNVRGEVSNLKAQPSGQLYFDLKEGDVVLGCVAWKRDAERLPEFANGDEIVASGEVLAYVQKSRLQLVVRAVTTGGVGSVHARYEALKRKLAAEGMFLPERKRPLPAHPFRIAIVSSRRADGGIDFEQILHRRAPHVTVVWCETAVQGPNAPIEIASAIDRASAAAVDAIVVTRGGGSFEDLICFSHEAVVRAIVRARHPVVSAVGHTVNQQLCDFAADVHAETPSAAAELVSDETASLLLDVRESALRLERKMRARLERERRDLAMLAARAVFASPERIFVRPHEHLQRTLRDVDDALRARFDRARRHIDSLDRRLEAHSPARRLQARGQRLAVATYRLGAAAAPIAERRRERLRAREARLAPALARLLSQRAERLRLGETRLEGRDPEAILARGYAIVTHAGRIVRDPRALESGAPIEARLARGTLFARVEREPEAGDPDANCVPRGND